ncbi:MAG: ferredoxin [Oscillospiraceae bacterium]|nr:ferredoxin [Oscillospiraceae bacterium]
MFINSKTAEENALLHAACEICAAARTAPKACGIDVLDTAILTSEDKDAVANEMRRLAGDNGDSFFCRDADNLDAAQACVLVGAKWTTRHLGHICQLCGFDTCRACEDAGARCIYPSLDLGIALGSAVASATDMRIDTRIMFTIGKAAASLKLLGDCELIMGIPLSVSGKSPFFDREGRTCKK